MVLPKKRVGATRDEYGNTTPVGRSGSRPVVGGSISRNSSSRGGSPSASQNDIASNFSDILARLAGSSDNSILQLLQSLGINQEAGLTGSQRDDWNKQLLDTLINYSLTQENRSYNESMRDEQRLYDSPLNQLARLMGAGVSRDAAIQMLSGGSQPIQSDAASAAEGIAPSESRMNGINAALAPAQFALDAIGSVGSLIGLGFSVPQAIQHTKMLSLSNQLSSQQLNGYNVASNAFGVLNSIGASAESFGSAASAISAIQNAANKGDKNALSFVNSGGLDALSSNSYFASQALSHLYRSERSSNDYNTSFGLFVDQTEADIDFKRANKDNVVQSTLNLQAEFEETAANTEFIEAQKSAVAYSINVMKEQANLLRKQGRTEEAKQLAINANTLYTKSQTTAQNLQNQLTKGIYNTKINVGDQSTTGFQALTYGAAVQAYNDMKTFVFAHDKRIWEKELNALAQNYDRLYNVSLIMSTFASGALDKYNSDPQFKDLMITCSAMQQCGAFDYINTKLKANSANNVGQLINNWNALEEFGIQ